MFERFPEKAFASSKGVISFLNALEEINSWEEKVNSSFESSYEDGLLDGRKELAENLLEQITKWEEE